MEGTIQAMAATVESRDAYTAGHQRRVAELVLAMAGEMHLAENDIHAVHLAAIVHDLGKIQVPAEILSKPGKLLPLEFELIKYHPTSGYNILKDVDFPWPIAEIVYQHHERLDGSGYPRGLKGDEILLAAKILAVADTVEAMSSHRPYRAALGIDSALAEIERGRGSVYDAAAVDTCLKLFREKRFAFST
jgi:putative nucleotidyltransferase with HDIG domain